MCTLHKKSTTPSQVIGQMRDKLRLNCAPLQLPLGLEHEHRGLIDLVDMRAVGFEGSHGQDLVEAPVPESMRAEADRRRAELVERVAEVDEALGELFLMEEPIDAATLRAAIRRATISLAFVPVFMGRWGHG